MKLTCFPKLCVGVLQLLEVLTRAPRLGHRMVTFRSEEGYWSLETTIGAAIALDRVKVQHSPPSGHKRNLQKLTK